MVLDISRISSTSVTPVACQTPAQALADGADLLVIGRPITAAADPAQAARQIQEALIS
jgi:orotidine-5'-phosphate decarboxylase